MIHTKMVGYDNLTESVGIETEEYARKCSECKHCYIEEANGWHFPEPLSYMNIEACCDRINPDKMHVASFVGMNSPICKHFQQRPHPIRIYPPRTERMVKAGQWWTDIEPEPIPAQRSLDAWF